MDKRYTALRIIGTIYKVVGLIAAAITVLSALGLCATSVLGGPALDQFAQQYGGGDTGVFGLAGGMVWGLVAGISTLILGGLSALGVYAIGEGIYLVIALEENTRASATVLYRQEVAPGMSPSAR